MKSAGSKWPGILVIDSNDQTERIRRELAPRKVFVAGCETFAEGLRECQLSQFDVVVIAPGPATQCKLESLAALLQADPTIRVIVHTERATKDDVKAALHCGAFAFVEKAPSCHEELVKHTLRAIGGRIFPDETRLEKTFRESEKFRLLFNSTFQLIGMLSPQGILLEANDPALEFGGIAAADVLQRPFWEAAWFHGLDAEVENLKAAIERAASGEFIRYTTRARGVNGIENIDFSIKPVFDERGKVKWLLPEGRLVTEQERAKKALRRSEEKFRSLVEHAPLCIHEIDREGKILSMNAAGLKLMGSKNESEVVGMKCLEAVSPGDRRHVGQMLTNALAGESVYFAFETPSGQHFESCLVPLKNEHGETRRIMGITQDATERVRAEAQLRASEAQARTIFEQAAVGVALIDSTKGTIRQVNQRCWEILGYDSASQVRDKSWMELIHPDDLDTQRSNLQKLWKGEIRKLAMEKRLKRRDESYVWVYLTVSPMWQRGETPDVHIAIIEDISDRRLAEQKLHFTQFSVDSCSSLIFWIRQDASFFYVNEAVSRELGYSEEEMLSMTVHDIDPDYPVSRWAEFWESIRCQLSMTFESQIQHKNGRMIPVEITTNLLKFENEEFVFAFASNITARKKSEEALLFQADLLNRVSDAVLVTDKLGNVTYANDAAFRLFASDNTSFPDVMEQILAIVQLSGGDETMALNRLESSGHWHGECDISTNSQTLSLDTQINSFKVAGRESPFLLCVMRDVSARKRVQQEIREQEQMLSHMTRLNTMGELLTGIAHEVKQPLYAVTNFATAASVTLEKMTLEGRITHDWLNQLKECNEGVRNAAQHASDIIRRSRDFAKKDDQRHEPIDVADIVDDSIRLISFEARMKKTRVIAEIEPDLPTVYGEKIQCEQVLVNLLHNAVEILNDFAGRRMIVVRALQRDSFIEFQVEDSGPGIPPGASDKIFEAFNTARPGGLGLGLAISRTIVQNHGGRIWTSTGELGGALFHFTLPVRTQRSH